MGPASPQAMVRVGHRAGTSPGRAAEPVQVVKSALLGAQPTNSGWGQPWTRPKGSVALGTQVLPRGQESLLGACRTPGSPLKEPVLAACQALTQVQWCVPQPISLVGVGSVVQKQLHWKQRKAPEEPLGASTDSILASTPPWNTESQYAALCSFTPLPTREACVHDAGHCELRLLGGSLSPCRYYGTEILGLKKVLPTAVAASEGS